MYKYLIVSAGAIFAGWIWLKYQAAKSLEFFLEETGISSNGILTKFKVHNSGSVEVGIWFFDGELFSGKNKVANIEIEKEISVSAKSFASGELLIKNISALAMASILESKNELVIKGKLTVSPGLTIPITYTIK